jgi:hypothetical protein
MPHTNPHSSESFDFVDISREQFREYNLAGGTSYRIENPVALYVKESGSHRVVAKMPNGQYESHYIDAEGKRPVKWVVGPGEPFFLGWGKTSAEGTPVPITQPTIDAEVRSGASLRSEEAETISLEGGAETTTLNSKEADANGYDTSDAGQIMSDAGLEIDEGGLRNALNILEGMPAGNNTVSISGDEDFQLTVCTENGCVESRCSAEELTNDLYEYLDQLGERAIIRATPDGFRVEAIAHQ